MTLPLAILALCWAIGAARAEQPPAAGDESYESFLNMLRETSIRETLQPSQLAKTGARDSMAASDQGEAVSLAAQLKGEEPIVTEASSPSGVSGVSGVSGGPAVAGPAPSAPESASSLSVIPEVPAEEPKGKGKAWVPEAGSAVEKLGGAETEMERTMREKLDQLKEQRVTLNFKEADLQNVIRVLARHGGLNVVIPPQLVKGNVTLYLDDVPILTAMDSLLRSNELTYVIEDGNILRIVKLEKVEALDRPMMQTVHIPLNWIKAADATKVLDPIVKDVKGQITADEATNSIIVSAPPPAMARVTDIVRRLDVPDKQVDIETRFVELSRNAQRDLGAKWSWTHTDTTGNSSLGINSGNVPFTKGASWTWADTVGECNIKVQLDALELRGDAEILANPRLTTLNNVKAKIDLTRKEPYTETTFNPGGQTTYAAKFEKVGIEMEVTPIITNNGYVRLNIDAKQYILQEFRDLPSGKVPVISTRQSTTNVIVKDEGTAGLMGLRQVEATKSITGTPWMHRIPFFGWLFKNQTDNQARVDLAVFITPHILKDPNLTADQQQKYDRLDMRWDLPDYYFDDTKLDSDEAVQ